MKTEVHHVGYGRIEYEESFWSGKRIIKIDNRELTKKSRNIYILKTEDGDLECKVKGSFIFGVSLYIDQDIIQLTEHCKWYEMFLSMLICVFVLIWGNIPALCKIFPVVGGAIGGGISGAAMCVNLVLMKQKKNVAIKLLSWLGMFVGTVLVCALLGKAIIVFFT